MERKEQKAMIREECKKDATKARNRRQSVSNILEEVKYIICDAYCKYPDIWDDEKEGCELANSEICGNCVLNLL